MEIIGHRGSSGTHPENTLLGLETAVAAGAPWLEIDVRLAAGELFVIHDDTVDRTTNGSGSIYAMSAAEIHALDAGAGQAIPTLAQVLDVVDAKASLNVELKDTASMAPSLQLLENTLRKYPAWDQRLMVSTFEQSIHASLAEQMPNGALLGVLLNETSASTPAYAAALGAYSLNLSFAQLDQQIVQVAHDHGLKVYVYTVNEPVQIDRCLSLAVDAIYTDFPARSLSYLAET